MGNFTLIEIHTLYVHIATSLTQFRKKTLTVGGGITVRLVSIISRLDSTATLQTNWDTFSSFVIYDLETSRTYSDPSPSHILWWSTASLHSNSNIFSSLIKSNLVKLETSRTVIIPTTVSILCVISHILWRSSTCSFQKSSKQLSILLWLLFFEWPSNPMV